MPNENFVSENIVEIRYKALPEILDFRGELATAISRNMKLEKWEIDQNRVDVHDKEDNIHVFVSFVNAGIVVKNTKSEEFVRVIDQYFRLLFQRKPFPSKLELVRIGCKTKVGYAAPLSFENLVSKYSSILHVSDKYNEIMDGDLIDIGFPLNFKTEFGNLNSTTGPMKKDQLKTFFPFVENDNLPDVALYVEFDYWDQPKDAIIYNQLIPQLLGYAKENWDKAERIKSLVMANE